LQNFVDFDLWFIWAGRGTMRTVDETIDLFPGRIFCLRPRTFYSATHDPARRLGVCYLHFDFLTPDRSVTTPPVKNLPPHHCVLGDVAMNEGLLRLAVDDVHSGVAARVARASQVLSMVLTSMTIEASAAHAPPRERAYREAVASVMRRVRENPGQMASVDELADHAGYGVDHFGRIFRQIAGVTPKEFAIRVRLDRARHLLRDSAMSVEAISRSLGYADVFFFSRQFKQRAGLSPTQWRKRGQEPARGVQHLVSF